MSLLFDALRRAQGSSAGSRTTPAATGMPGILSRTRYIVAALVLLTVVAAWFYYSQVAYAPISTQHVMPDAISSVQQQSGAASGVAGAESNTALAQAEPPTSASDASVSVGKKWTQPIAEKKPRSNKRKSGKKRQKSVKVPAGLPVSAEPDLLHEGYLALSDGNLDQAEQKYLAALARRPHEKDALLGLAVIAQRKMQTERAADLYRQVLREDLGNAPAAAGLVSLSSQADPQAAESQLKELIDIKPSAPEFHNALGSALARQQRWGEAQQAFFRACKLEPANALYAYNLAVSLDRLQQSAAALTYYEKASILAKPNDQTIDLDAIGRRMQELKIVGAR